MRGKYDELVSSMGKEKDGEVVALRKQLDDLQASFEATQASQTEATAELVQVKGALSETTALLEQSKDCLLYTSPSPRDLSTSRMPSSA